MKITCEHCGCVINTDKDSKCPNCGAPYSRNKEYSEVKDVKKKHTDYDLREREADIHSKELQNKIVENTLNGIGNTKKFSAVFIVIFIMIFIAAIAIFAFNFRTVSKTKEQTQNNTQNKVEDIIDDIINKKEEQITINFNENHSNDKYEIKCDGVSKYTLDKFEKNKKVDYVVYSFHIVFKNKTTDWKTLNDINLTYTDDKGNEDVAAKKHSPNSNEASKQLDYFAKEKVTYTGNISYEIPKYVKNVNLKFENVTIKIDNFKNHVK